MAGKAIDKSARGVLILIVPIAMTIVILFKAWPVLLALVSLSSGFSIWQSYRWQRWSQQFDPIFHQLVRENRGCVTPLDLSMKANLSGIAAKRYLDAKASEFGAGLQDFEDRGTAYYFITASSLGGIFDDSTPNYQLDSESSTDESRSSAPLQRELAIESRSTQQQEELEQAEQKDDRTLPNLSPAEGSEELKFDSPGSHFAKAESRQQSSFDLPPDTVREAPEQPIPQKHRILQSLIQSELARRLDVHSSTVLKRRDDPDFPEWSRSRDPEGIAWEFSADTREFYPLENQ